MTPGIVRVSCCDVNNNGSMASTEVMEETNYYPFGLTHKGYNVNVYSTNIGQKNKYNGMEWQNELLLNMYDMDFRDYDPAIARWVVIDPIIHHSLSPYNAFDNNPVFWADPSGANSSTTIMDLFNNAGSGVTTYTNNNNGTFTETYFSDEEIIEIVASIEEVMSNMLGGGGSGDGGNGGIPILAELFKQKFPKFDVLWNNYPHDIEGEYGHQHPSKDGYQNR